jgi:hypothetical protein
MRRMGQMVQKSLGPGTGRVTETTSYRNFYYYNMPLRMLMLANLSTETRCGKVNSWADGGTSISPPKHASTQSMALLLLDTSHCTSGEAFSNKQGSSTPSCAILRLWRGTFGGISGRNLLECRRTQCTQAYSTFCTACVFNRLLPL